MPVAKDQLSPTWPTVFELASTIAQMDLSKGSTDRGSRNRPPVTQGLIPQEFPNKEGYYSVTPEQIASLRVPTIEVNGDIRGFQRAKENIHARKIARAILAGDEMPPMMISIFPDGRAYVDDGQHRALGAVIARKPIEVVVKRRTVEQARKLFANQSRARKLKSDDTLLTGDSPLELYIQDALTSDNHAWSAMVTTSSGGQTNKMSPTSMAIIVGSYVFNTLNQGTNFLCTRPVEQWDDRKGDQLAKLIQAFGTKTTNPLAFRARSLRAISHAAVYIFQRNKNVQKGDVERWLKHMPMFDFTKFPHLLNKENELAAKLVEHWNKRLPEARRVEPWNFR